MEDLLPDRDPPPPPIDWRAVGDAIGVDLPDDYREFCERWGRVRIDDDVNIESPADDNESGLVGLVTWKLDLDRDARDDGDWDGRIWPEPGGLLPWGWTEEGETLLWRTDTWHVVLRRDDEAAPDYGAITETGLEFRPWLWDRLSRSPRPLPLEMAVAETKRPIWVPRGHPEDVDMGVEDLPNTWRLSLNMGGVLGEPREVVLNGFLASLRETNPKAAAAIVSSRARYSRELITVTGGWRGRRRVEQIRDAAIDYCRR
jgi:hypothetical protein